MTRRDGARRYDQPTTRSCCKRCDVALDFGGVPQIDCAHFHAKRRPCGLDRAILAEPGGNCSISKDCDAIYFGCDLLKQVQPFSTDAVFKKQKAGSVAARSCKAFDITGSDRIGNGHEYNGHGAGNLYQRPILALPEATIISGAERPFLPRSCEPWHPCHPNECRS